MTRELHIDRLTLRVPGISPTEGRRLAELVGHGLSRIPPDVRDRGTVRVSLAARPGERIEATAARITTSLRGSL